MKRILWLVPVIFSCRKEPKEGFTISIAGTWSYHRQHRIYWKSDFDLQIGVTRYPAGNILVLDTDSCFTRIMAEDTLTGHWTVNKNKLEMTGKDTAFTYQIIALNLTDLTLSEGKMPYQDSIFHFKEVQELLKRKP